MLNPKQSTFQIFVFLFFGIFLGLLVSKILNLPNRWMIVVLLGISLPFVGFVLGDLRRFFIFLLIMTIPLNIDVNFVQKYEFQAGAHTAGIALRDIFVIFILVVWIIERISNEGLKLRFFHRLTLPALLYIEICLVTFLWAPRVDLATLEIIQMAKVFLLFFILANSLRSVEDLRFVLWTLLLTLGLEGSLAIVQMVTGKSLGLGFLGEYQVRMGYGDRLNRVAGTLGHPNKLAMYLEIILPLAAALFYSSHRSRERVFAAAVFGLGVTGLIFTGSRGSWIAFFLSMALFVFIILKRRMVDIRTVVAPTAIMFLIVITLFASFWSRVENRITGDDHGSAVGRIPLIQVAWRVIQAYPYGGVGLNNYAVIMGEYDNTILGRKYTRLERPVHNTYLLIAAETGAIGFAAFLWLIFSVYKAGLRGIRQPDSRLSFIGIGIVCGLLAFMVHGLVEKHPPGGYPLFYVIMAIAANVSAPYFGADQSSTELETSASFEKAQVSSK